MKIIIDNDGNIYRAIPNLVAQVDEQDRNYFTRDGYTRGHQFPLATIPYIDDYRLNPILQIILENTTRVEEGHHE